MNHADTMKSNEYTIFEAILIQKNELQRENRRLKRALARLQLRRDQQ